MGESVSMIILPGGGCNMCFEFLCQSCWRENHPISLAEKMFQGLKEINDGLKFTSWWFQFLFLPLPAKNMIQFDEHICVAQPPTSLGR